jgi:hypothetical protein
MIFDAERIGLVFRMVQDVDSPRKEPAVVVERLGLDEHIRARLLGIRDDLERENLENILTVRALPARHRCGKDVGETEQEPGFVRDQAMLEQAEQLPLALVAVDVVEELQGRLRAPAQEERREGVRRRPLQDVGDFRPEGLLFDAGTQRVDARDDEAVELLVPNVAERAIELTDVIGGRIPGVTPSRYAAHVRVRRDEGEIHLQHRVAEPKCELAFGRDLVRHQVDDRDLQRTNVLLFGAAAVDRQRAAERRQEGWISWLWMMTGILEGSLTQTFARPGAAKANINYSRHDPFSVNYRFDGRLTPGCERWARQDRGGGGPRYANRRPTRRLPGSRVRAPDRPPRETPPICTLAGQPIEAAIGAIVVRPSLLFANVIDNVPPTVRDYGRTSSAPKR